MQRRGFLVLTRGAMDGSSERSARRFFVSCDFLLTTSIPQLLHPKALDPNTLKNAPPPSLPAVQT